MNKSFQHTNNLEKILREIIFYGTCLILFTPLILNGKFFFPYVGPKSIYFMGLVEIIFFVWLYLIIFSKNRPKFNLLSFSLLIFLIIFILASIFGIDPSYSFWSKFERMTGVLMFLHLFAFFIVISSVLTKKQWQWLFYISISVSIIIVFLALFSEKLRKIATLGNDSFVGTYLLFNVFIALYLFFKSETNILKIYSFISFYIIGLGIILSNARAVKLCFLASLFLLVFLYLAFASKKKFLNLFGKISLVIVLLISIISVFLFFQTNSFIQQKFIQATTKARLVVWQGAWPLFLERPWLGWGPENFEIIFAKNFNPCMFLPECGREIWFDRTHNIILDTLISAGILGLLSYLLIFIFSFYILWKGFLKKEICFWTTSIFSVMLISYFIQNMVVFDMVSSYMMFFLVLGFINNLTIKKDSSEQQSDIYLPFVLNWKTIIIFIFFIICFNKFIIQPLKSDFYVIKAGLIKNSIERISFYKKALSSPVGRYQIRENFAYNIMNYSEQNKITKFSKNFISEIDFLKQELEKSIKESPLNFRSYLTLGKFYNFYGKIDKSKLLDAENVLKKAIELSSTNQLGYWELAVTKILQGENDEALILTEKALELEKRLPKSHLLVIEVAKLKGDKELIKKKAEQALNNIDFNLEENQKLKNFLLQIIENQ